MSRSTPVEDINQKKMPAMTIFAMSIRYLKEHFWTAVNKQTTGLLETDVRYVITIPAIWDDNAKQFMREAAVEVIFIYSLSLKMFNKTHNVDDQLKIIVQDGISKNHRYIICVLEISHEIYSKILNIMIKHLNDDQLCYANNKEHFLVNRRVHYNKYSELDSFGSSTVPGHLRIYIFVFPECQSIPIY